MTTRTTASVAVFDIGGVLIEWDPRHLYRKLIPDTAAMEEFLATVCTAAWNLEQDRGRGWGQAVADLSARHPEHADMIAAYHLRWEEMLPGAVPGTAELVHALKARGTPVYAITNFSAEKLPLARRRFDVLNRFDGMIVSGVVGLTKPDPAIYRRLLDDYGLNAVDTLFIDDVPRNVEGARAAGMNAVPFTDALTLRADLERFGLL